MCMVENASSRKKVSVSSFIFANTMKDLVLIKSRPQNPLILKWLIQPLMFVSRVMKVVERGNDCDPKLFHLVCVKEMRLLAWIMRGTDVWFNEAKDEFLGVTAIFNTRVSKDETLKHDFLKAMENYILNVENP